LAEYRLTPEAANDVDSITEFTRETWSLSQALDYTDDLYDAFEQLAGNPGMGRSEAELNDALRSKPVGSHRIYYTVGRGHITILRILHTAQDPDAAFPPPTHKPA
jgi:toxin ParE1/3/4